MYLYCRMTRTETELSFVQAAIVRDPLIYRTYLYLFSSSRQQLSQIEPIIHPSVNVSHRGCNGNSRRLLFCGSYNSSVLDLLYLLSLMRDQNVLALLAHILD